MKRKFVNTPFWNVEAIAIIYQFNKHFFKFGLTHMQHHNKMMKKKRNRNAEK